MQHQGNENQHPEDENEKESKEKNNKKEKKGNQVKVQHIMTLDADRMSTVLRRE